MRAAKLERFVAMLACGECIHEKPEKAAELAALVRHRIVQNSDARVDTQRAILRMSPNPIMPIPSMRAVIPPSGTPNVPARKTGSDCE